jgi:hypothetical protein
MRIDSSGNVGIRTTSPGTALDVNGAVKANYNVATGSLAAYVNSGGGLYSYYLGSGAGIINAVSDNSGTAGTLIFNTGIERARITADGKLGLGTGSPSKTLDIAAASGTVGITSNTTSAGNEPTLTFTHAGNNGYTIKGGSNLEFASDNGANPRMTLTTAGKLGLGTSTPVGKLTLGNSTNNFLLDLDSSASYTEIQSYNAPLYLNRQGNNTILNSGSGNVGIGTVSPSQLLHLSGGDALIERSSGYASLYFNAATGSVRSAAIQKNFDSPYDLKFVASTNTSPAAATSISFQNYSGNEIGRWDLNGRLLVGTPSIASGGYVVAESARFLVQGRVGNSTDSGRINLQRGSVPTVSNQGIGGIYFTDSSNNGYASIESSCDGTTGTDDYPGRLVFSTTADGSPSPTPRMTIDSAGNVGIGRSPTDVLDVYRSSGAVNVKCDSDSLSNGNTSGFVAQGGARQAAIGVFKHASITNPCAYLELRPEDNGANYLWVDNSDQFRISSNAEHIGTTNGTVVGAQTSDERVKNILGPVEYGLDTLKQIETVRFSLKSEPEAEKLGFIAQQVQPLVPESVFDTDEHIEGEPEDAPTKLGMEYVALIPVLVNAVKELSAEVDALKAQLQA